jgi:cytochrome P450
MGVVFAVGEIGFGTNIDSLGDPDHPFAKAFDGAQYHAEKRFFWPLWFITDWITPEGYSYRHAIKVLDDFSYKLIKERRDSGAYLKGTDVLSQFMQMKDDSGKYVVLHEDKYLRDVVMNFMIAGRDTTAQALSWTVYMLGQHPEVEREMVREIDSVCKGGKAIPSFDDTKSMKYTQAVVKETLRLWPSVPKDMKQAVVEDVLPDGTRVPAGAFVVYVPFAMGRDKEIWGADATEFKPERFVKEPNPDPYKYPVFNAGLRQCLGKEMAVTEATVLLAAIYKRFSLQLVPGQEIVPLSSLTMPQEKGVRVRVLERHPETREAI